MLRSNTIFKNKLKSTLQNHSRHLKTTKIAYFQKPLTLESEKVSDIIDENQTFDAQIQPDLAIQHVQIKIGPDPSLVSILSSGNELNPQRAAEFLNQITLDAKNNVGHVQNTADYDSLPEIYPESLFTKLLFLVSSDPDIFTPELSMSCLEYMVNFDVCVPQVTKHLLHNCLRGVNDYNLQRACDGKTWKINPENDQK